MITAVICATKKVSTNYRLVEKHIEEFPASVRSNSSSFGLRSTLKRATDRVVALVRQSATLTENRCRVPLINNYKYSKYTVHTVTSALKPIPKSHSRYASEDQTACKYEFGCNSVA